MTYLLTYIILSKKCDASLIYLNEIIDKLDKLF